MMFTNDEDDFEKEEDYYDGESYRKECDKEGNDDCDDEHFEDGDEDVNNDSVDYIIHPLDFLSISKDPKQALPSKGIGKLSLGRGRWRIAKSKSTPAPLKPPLNQLEYQDC